MENQGFRQSPEKLINVKVDSVRENADEQVVVQAEKKRKKFRRRMPKEPRQYRSIQMTSGVTFNGLSTAKHPTTGDGQLIYPDGSIYNGKVRKG